MQMSSRDRGMTEKAFPQIREVSVRVSGRRHTFIDLKDMNLVPGHIVVRERAQHHPRRVSPAESGRELTACSDSSPSISRDNMCGSSGGGFCIVEDVNLHKHSPPAALGKGTP